MSIKILGGYAKGFTVKVPKNHTFRPTLSTLKRKVFDRYQNLENFYFFDCFAGSGAIGLEALSRGAESAVFFEKSSKHFIILKENVNLFNSKYQTDLGYYFKINNEDFLSTDFPLDQKLKTIFFIDPPYAEEKLYFKALEKTKEFPSLYWIEGDSSKGPSSEEILEKSFLKNFKNYKVYQQGSHYILCIENLNGIK